MKIIKDYTTEQERQQIIDDMVSFGSLLLGDQSHIDGKHLVFESMPLCARLGQLSAINVSAVKPATVTFLSEGRTYTFRCFISQHIKDEYTAGKIVIGDYLLVEFVDNDANRPLVIGKVFKTW